MVTTWEQALEKLQSMASRYYEAFEGIHLYPKLRNTLGLVWLLSLLMFVLGLALIFTKTTYREPIFYFTAVAFLLTSAAAEDYRIKSLTAKVGKDFHIARIAQLEQITGRRSSQFLELAKEASELLALQKQFTPQRFSFRRLIYSASMKGQLIPIFIGVMGIFLVVFQKAFAIEPEQFFEIFSSPGLWTLAAIALFFLFLFFFFTSLMLYSYSEFSDIFKRWRAKVGIQKPSARVELDYFLRHLITYHDPEHKIEEVAPAIATAQLRQARKPIRKARRFHRGLR